MQLVGLLGMIDVVRRAHDKDEQVHMARVALGHERCKRGPSEAHGTELGARDGVDAAGVAQQLDEAARLLEKARAAEGHFCGPEGHPWACETGAALAEYRGLREKGADATAWRDALKERQAFWCAQVLAGAAPFPPKPRPRLQDAAALIQRLPGHNECLSHSARAGQGARKEGKKKKEKKWKKLDLS